MKFLRDLFERARMLLFRKREERELAEELRFHLEMEAEQNERAGMSQEDAHRRGVFALGGVERVKEDVRDARGTRLLEDSLADFRYALRSLRQAPGFTMVAVLTLALGIGSTTAVFSAVDTVLLQPLPYEQSGQLVRLYYYDKDPALLGFVSPVHFLDYRSQLTSIAAIAGEYTYRETGGDVGSGDRAHRIQLLPVTADYFDVLRAYPAIGHVFTRDDETDAPTVVLSDRLWREEFNGESNVVGRTLTVNGRRVTVAGVMPPGFADPIVGAVDAWTPMDMRPGKDLSNTDNHFVSVVARLKPGVPVARAQAELDVLNRALDKQYPDAPDARARLIPLKDDLVGPSSFALELLLGAVGLVLLLVCVNVANLLLVRGSARAREFALRAALGAERARLVRQLLIESLTLAIAGDLGGLIVARLGMSAIVALGGASIPRLADMTLNGRLLGFSLAIASVCAVAFGLAPAFRAARAQPTDMLREQGRSATSGRGAVKLRDWLVVSQVALAFVLMVGAGLLIASFERMRQIDLGVRPGGILTFELNLPPARYDSTARAHFYEAVAERMRSLPGAIAAGGVSTLPATGAAYQWGTRASTGPLVGTKEGYVLAQQRVITGNYFAAVGIPVLEGRAFDTRDDGAAPRRVLVSQSVARRLFPKMSAVGQRLSAGGRNAEIVGVVGDVALDAEGRATAYVYHAHTQFANRPWTIMQVIRTNGSVGALQSAARHALADLDPQLVVYKPMPLTDAIGQGESQRRFMLRVLTTFAAIALALAALGLFGVLSYGVGLRTREFGIRMALGADRGSIRRAVLRQGLVVTAIGTAVGLVGALALSRVMATLVFHMSPLDPWVLLGAVVFMAMTGAVAAFVPAHRATTVDPRTALQ